MKMIELECSECGKKFERSASVVKYDRKKKPDMKLFCSRKCQYAGLKFQPKPNLQFKELKKEIDCFDCKKKLLVSIYAPIKNKNVRCKECKKIHRRIKNITKCEMCSALTTSSDSKFCAKCRADRRKELGKQVGHFNGTVRRGKNEIHLRNYVKLISRK